MKTLLLLRHAKSDWEADFDQDHERPLKKRGRKDARRIGRLLAETGQLPEFVLCSSAVRARETLAEAVKGGAWPGVETRVTDALYDASPDGVLAEIRQAPDEATRLLAIGHDPAWSDLASRLLGGCRLGLPTAGLVRIDFDVESWQSAGAGPGELAWFVVPRLLR